MIEAQILALKNKIKECESQEKDLKKKKEKIKNEIN